MLATIDLEGRRLTLTECLLSRTYSGLLTGRPNRDTNRLIYEDLKREAERMAERFGRVPPIWVVPLPDKEWLPHTLVAGVFEGEPIGNREPGDNFSWAVIAWFQHGSQHVEVEALKGLPWEQVARNGGY
jgi:hypothetical protein